MPVKMKFPGTTLIISMLGCLLPALQPNAALPVSFDKDGIFHFVTGEPKSAVFTAGARQYLIAAIAFEGVIVLTADGEVADYLELEDPLSEATSVAVSDSINVNNQSVILVAIADEAKSTVLLRGLDPQSGRFVDNMLVTGELSVPTDLVPSHLCFAQDVYDQSLYLYTGGEHGQLSQYRVVIGPSGNISLKPVRTISIGGETGSCIADNNAGIVYALEPEVGLWSIEVDPETDPLRKPAAVVKPFGDLQDPVSVTLIMHRQEILPLVIDTDAEAFLRLSPNGKASARLSYSSAFGRAGINGEVENISIGRFPLNGKLQDVLAIAIQGESGGGDIHLVSAGSLGTTPEFREPESVDAIVSPVIETDSAPSTGDAADDPAIWIHPEDPALSLVLGTDKNGGLMVMDLAGKMIQFLPDGRLNNVDIKPVKNMQGLDYIAAATDRTNSAIALYTIDPDTRNVSRVDARTIPAEFYDPYGLCMYHSNKTNDLYVIATSGDGLLQQWRLFPAGNGKVDAELIRKLTVGTVAEGCVADDETGYLYVAEEDIGIWRYGAEPDAGDDRIAIDRVKPDGKLTDDVEGISIYSMPDGNGYIVASSQGSDSYAVYDRKPPNTFRGMFRIRANASAGIDGVSETDGLDVTSVPLPGYPEGLLVVQDGRNIEPVQNQNFKFVSWRDIITALELESQ